MSMRFLFRQHIEEQQNRPVRINLRFIRTRRNRELEDDTILRMAATQFRHIFQTQVIPAYFRGRSRDTSRIRGWMNMYSSDVNRAYNYQELRGDEVSYESLVLMHDTVIQSNMNVDLTYTEWTYSIDPRMGIQGGHGTVKSNYRSNKYKDTYMEHEDSQGKINCAAFALTVARLYSQKCRDAKKNLMYWKQQARLLQTEMKWDDIVSVMQLQEFVQKYPQYRVTCLFNAQGIHHFRNTTFEGTRFDASRAQEQALYLVYDATVQHFYAVSSPAQYFVAETGVKAFTFCHYCVERYRMDRTEHSCEHTSMEPPRKKKQVRKCEFCKNAYTNRRCSCRMQQCLQCRASYLEGQHRCIVTQLAKELDFNKVSLWAYDLEARMEITEMETDYIEEFELEEYRFTGKIVALDTKVHKHKANLVVARNVFTDEERIFEGDHCLQNFIQFCLSHNQGHNIFVAHNASGYDSRLIFEELLLMDMDLGKPIMRGSKFIQIQIGKTKFIDSLLHLPGSLRDLAKAFCSDIQLEKGYFPHLFNSVSNYSYHGPIPDKKFFDLSFVIRNDKEVKAFDDWYAEWEGRDDWNFQTELKKYCQNDVLVLAKIMRSYHDILVEKTGLSPWAFATAPRFVHEVYLRHLVTTLDLPDPKEDPHGYAARVTELGEKEYWCVLKGTEYWFARKALRGGRTEIRKVYHTVSQEEWDRGVRIRYQDICSQYPYQQAVHDFPVGAPTIYLWDTSVAPCSRRNHARVGCDCPTLFLEKGVKVITDHPVPTAAELMDPKWFGIVCCTVEPPKNMYHPVLVHYDEQLNKSVASCNRIEKGVFTSVEFQKALEMGYQIIQIHRFDVYHKKPSLWADVIKDFFVEKMVNSSNMPSPEDQERLVREYEDKFEMGDMLLKTFREQRWTKNEAKKKAFKIMLNSGWGKHAQRPDLVETRVIQHDDEDKQLSLLENISQNKVMLKGITYFENKNVFRTQETYMYGAPDIHSSYITAALFVPAYGRLQLWEQLHKLGKRVLMNDTDSIVYVYDPDQYNIPESDVWGGWEVEDIDKKNGGIRTFIGLGPKTYAIKCENGETLVKCKGLSLKRSTERLINFHSMEELIRLYLDRGDIKKIKVPQMTFDYKLGNGIHTRYLLKQLCFNPNELKGDLDDQGYLYPFGFIE